MANKYFHKDKSYTQDDIQRKLSTMYKKLSFEIPDICFCCSKKGESWSHIISRKRCKELRLTEYIWAKWNLKRKCIKCHDIWEGKVSGTALKNLVNVDLLMKVWETYDPRKYKIRKLAMK